MKKSPDRRLCVAPMMRHTDRHFRYLLRLISRRVMLYTEMITTGALLHGETARYLRFHPAEHPVGIQLGGSDPAALAQCARLAEDHDYDEVNLNIGCPSNRVSAGRFGACLLAEPQLVAECVAGMQSAVKIPVTVKTRTGIDALDSYEHLCHFVRTVAQSGCQTFIIHARKAWLQGLSPKQNRELPPLQYERVYHLKRDFPRLEIILNGGIDSLEEIPGHAKFVDGVMLGRALCNNPYLLAAADGKIFNTPHAIVSRQETLHRFMQYIAAELAAGSPLSHPGRAIIGLYQGRPGARAYRRYLSENIYQANAGVEVVEEAMKRVCGRQKTEDRRLKA